MLSEHDQFKEDWFDMLEENGITQSEHDRVRQELGFPFNKR